MAVNTAFVASSELMERVAHRYNFSWIIKTNNRQSLYRIHMLSATFFSVIILLTGGSQKMLAEMYALGLVASFTINMGSLLIYRYSTGTKEIRAYNTSRSGTMIVFMILLSCFIYLSMTKPYGLALWAVVDGLLPHRRVPGGTAPRPGERPARPDRQPPADGLCAGREPGGPASAHLLQTAAGRGRNPRPGRGLRQLSTPPGPGSPPAWPRTTIGLPMRGRCSTRSRPCSSSCAMSCPTARFVVHFGWPLSSWLDRLAIGVMVFSMMQIPRMFPDFSFMIEYAGRPEALPQMPPNP